MFVSYGSAAEAVSENALRNAFDLLQTVPPLFEGSKGEPLSSWCGRSLDAGAQTRKAREHGAGIPRWADPVSRRKAFSEAWLALLRIKLPPDIYKARAPCLSCAMRCLTLS